MKFVFDCETDGLEPSIIWMIIAQNLDTGQLYRFSDTKSLDGSLADGASLLSGASTLIGHNILGFDIPVIDRLCGTNLIKKDVFDTVIMSRILSYVRKTGSGPAEPGRGHSLADWGYRLGNKKQEFDKDKFMQGNDPEVFNTMLKYCTQDVRVNVDIYNKLMAEFAAHQHSLKACGKDPSLFARGLRIEHDVAVFNAKSRWTGWKLDEKKGKENYNRMLKRLTEIENTLEPQIPIRDVLKDKARKKVKMSRNGNYHAGTARMLSELLQINVNPSDYDLLPATTEYQRIVKEPVKLGQVKFVKEWLQNDLNWKPTEYNRKKLPDGRFEQTGPKLTEDSLSGLGDIGYQLKEYLSVRNRAGVIEGWITRQRDGRIHGDMITVGTPTFRCTHKAIANLPAVNAEWGKEIRELLTSDEGQVIVGCDSAGNQLRSLCHYVQNPKFTNEIINGDQHSRNAETLGCSRPVSKTFLYAYLFGAGDAKLGQTLSGTLDAALGGRKRAAFAASIKGLKELTDKLEAEWKDNGKKFIYGLDGRKVYCGSSHQLLNYLLQSCEAITCKAAVSYAMRKIEAEGIKAEPRLMYHDEMAFQCAPEDAKRVGEILREAFREAPKEFNVNIMDGGEPTSGLNYAAVH